MTDYTDVFGGSTVAAADLDYSLISLTTDSITEWPYNYSGTTPTVAKITELTSTGVYELAMPPANQVSVGEALLLRNIGSNDIDIVDYDGGAITTISSGVAVYLYIKDNSSTAGTWVNTTFGTGTSAADAASLAGAGLQANGTELEEDHPSRYIIVTGDNDVLDTDRGKLLVVTNADSDIILATAASYGVGFSFSITNASTGTVSIYADAVDTIDGAESGGLILHLQPGEGTKLYVGEEHNWYQIGRGRSNIWSFTQLVKDVSAGGSFILTSTEYQNELLTFTGSPAGDVEIVLPTVVTSYYIRNNLSTAYDVTVITDGGAGVIVPSDTLTSVVCDGTDILAVTSI